MSKIIPFFVHLWGFAYPSGSGIMYTTSKKRATLKFMTLLLKAGQFQDQIEKEEQHLLQILLPLEANRGYVFLLAVVDKRSDAESLFRILKEQMERLAHTFGKDANPQHRFEQFLSTLNEQVSLAVIEGEFSIPIDRFHAVVGIACQNQMYLSGTGELFVLFLHKKKESQYQIFNLSRSIQTGQSLPTWEKVFAVVLDGDLNPGDVFTLSNLDLQRTINSDDLNTVLSTLPPNSAAAKLRQYFSHKSILSTLIIQSHTPATAQKMKELEQAKPLSEVSIENLSESRKQTTTLLEDQSPKFSLLITFLLKKLGIKKEKKGQRKRKNRLLYFFTRVCLSFLTVTWGIFSDIFSGTLRFFRKFITQKDYRNKLFSRTSENTKSSVGRVTGLPLLTKILSIALVVIVVVVFVSVSMISKQKEEQAALEAYAAQVTEAQEVIERGASAIIYKDEEQAWAYYSQANELIALLPTDTPERQTTKTDFENTIESALNELRHIVTIPSPPLLGDISGIEESLLINAFTILDGTIYLIGSDRTLYALNKVDKTFSPLIEDVEIDASTLMSAENGEIVFIDDRPGISLFSATDETWIKLSQEAQEGSWKDLRLYAGRLYILNTNGDQTNILRHLRSGDSFGSGSEWIKVKETPISDAVAFTIDGTIIILKSDGSVVRFAGGSEVSYSLETVDPPLNNPTRIWTDGESDHLYILEPTNSRVIVYEKESGEFISQYTSPVFTDLTGFFVDESTRSIYLLSGAKIYTIAASHL
jgi:hypothetical protein